MARPRKPAQLRSLSGDRRPSRTRIEPQPAATGPEAPEWLQGYAREVWDRTVEDLEFAGIAYRMDTDTIAAYCLSVAQLAKAQAALDAEGYVEVDHDHDHRRRRNPWLMVKASALDGINRFGSLLGMSPAARAHLGVPVRKADDYDPLLDGPESLLSR